MIGIVPVVLKVLALTATAVITGVTAYNAGRRKGKAEVKESRAEELKAIRTRLDELEAEEETC